MSATDTPATPAASWRLLNGLGPTAEAVADALARAAATGSAGDPDGCPLVAYLVARLGVPAHLPRPVGKDIDGRCVWLSVGAEWVPVYLPAAVAEFVNRFDRACGPDRRRADPGDRERFARLVGTPNTTAEARA